MAQQNAPEARIERASPPDELVKDLPVDVSEADASKVTGGKLAVEYKPLKADGSLDAAIQFKYDLSR